MPRIDPLQLLKCLSVLLSPEGGILSRDEVPRLVNLMTKFSKKLVSKCVYVLILKNTETSLVDMFMAEGGWTLIQSWLQDAAHTGNWDLVKEILGLLLITPVDVERLKMNCLPKLIKSLSRREDLPEVAKSSDQIVQKWLSIVKGTAASNNSTTTTSAEKKQEAESAAEATETEVKGTESPVTPVESKQQNKETEENQAIEPNSFYKSSVNKQNGRKASVESDKASKPSDDESVKSEGKDKERSKDKSKSSSRSKSSSSKEKEREKDKKKSSSGSSSKSSSSSSRSKDDKKDKDRKDRDKEGSSRSGSSSSKSSSKSSSSSSSRDKKDSKDRSKSSDSKEKSEKDKSSSEKSKPSIDKLGRIPKKSSDDKQKENKTDVAKSKEPVVEEKKKPSFSILNRKATGEERSKTVKVYNSKMRSTGLEEEAKPPPPRTGKKPTPSIQLPTIPSKRPSPPRDSTTSSGMPPEKKIKIDKVDIPERPGAIKLIPPKPKPAVLQESDMFMDALMTASVPKKDAKKRKRRPSVTKETPPAPTSPSSSPVAEPPATPTSPTLANSANALGLKNIAPINFYQDTLSEVSDKPEENSEECSEENKEVETNRTSPENTDTPASPPAAPESNETEMSDEVPAKQMRLDGELKGVLLYAKKKGPKRSIRWKEEEDLVEVRYFELDETERVNVTKTFMDMAKMDISSEREALLMSRKLPNEDVMEPQTPWRILYLCEQPDPLAIPGSKSLEKDIQFAREKSTLPAIYYDKRRIPDCPEEPIPENHQVSDPVVIPLEDPESQEIDLKSTPWPEPKGFAPNHMETQLMPPMFQNIPFNANFGNMGGNMPPSAPYGMPPRFPVPPGPHGPMGPGTGQFVPPNMMHNMLGPGPMNQPEMMNGPNPPMNSGGFIPGPDGYMGPGNEQQNFPMPQYGGPQGPNMNMYGGPNQNNFNNHRGGRGGGYRRGGNNQGNWVQLNNGPRNNNWKRGGGGGGGRGRLCKNIQNHGYCRNGDNCPFVH
ncbi:serine/threonine-protein phosphatase 1 regulatory subunit 10-like [Anthonomus grandis grandis]|uniref:serine/threonine-protein phosphatase 1 regulatory subunit 10-like n=1 Tax=Anthonomus grandis grandis TaxID=2921223 RepID=UPI00216603DB|nr:serine/threonine-protein phosphatase 1 regulatory subunit 10-like [Anthonomus grandis grandis]